MEYVVRQQVLEGLEQGLEAAAGVSRLHALLSLAWHLRQRDSRRAETLLAEFRRWLPRHRLPLAEANAVMARAALVACETACLFGRMADAQAELDQARNHLRPSVDGHAAGDAFLAEALLAKLSGDRERELHALESALTCFAKLSDRQRWGIAAGMLACDRGTSHASPGPVPQEEVDSCNAAEQAFALAAQAFPLCLRQPAEAAQLFNRSAALALDMGLLRFHCIMSMNASNACLALGDMEASAQCFEAPAHRARQTGWPLLMGMTQTQVGRVLRHLGRHQESLAALNEALLQMRGLPQGLGKAFACSELAFTLHALGQVRESVDVMWEAIQLFRAGCAMANLAMSLARQAHALAQLGQIDATMVALQEAQALSERFGCPLVDVEISGALAELHRRGAQNLPAPAGMTAPTATIHYAESALDRGRLIRGWRPPAALLDYLADACAEADQMRQAYAYSRQARLAHVQDGGGRLRNPRALLHVLGVQMASKPQDTVPPAAQAVAAARAAPPVPLLPSAPSQQMDLLTRKEQAVLQLLARNYSNKEIAQAMGVGAETVKWHLKGMFSKLEACSRKHAVTRARTLGMLQYPD
ncbi:LuxR C-terminal-related transcriptional regulator [Roseateles sp. PN1]|uniref:LuxR C-terminal-related transcriptional regulator n=1 Tax=Roseateles sp. PN1 TaxID=3137372 RepID=UPI004053856B